MRIWGAGHVGSTGYPAWGLSWTYDRYANRTAETVTAGTGVPSNSISVSTTTNRVITAGYAYDANGNMTNDGANTLVYDAENRNLSATNGSTTGSYTYDGNGLRIKKVSGSTTTVYLFSGSKVVAEYDNGAAPTAPSREYVYGGGALLAKIDSSGTKYFHQDGLSNRLVTSSTGTTLEQLGHFPYGESWYNSTGEKLLFTSYERDAESGNDYAMARYYINRLGRFASLDPFSGVVGDPQTLNHYAYVGNDPMNWVDPLGMLRCANVCPNFGDGGEIYDDSIYYVDGVQVSAAQAALVLSIGYGIQCPDIGPNSGCSGIRVLAGGTVQRWNVASVTGTIIINGNRTVQITTYPGYWEDVPGVPMQENSRLSFLWGGQDYISPIRNGPPNGRMWVNNGRTCRGFNCNGEASKDMDYHPPHGKDGGPVHDWVDGKRQQPGRWPRIGETWDDGMPLDPWLPLFSSPTAVESPVELNFFEPVFVF